MGMTSRNVSAITPPVSESRLALQTRTTLDAAVYRRKLHLPKNTPCKNDSLHTSFLKNLVILCWKRDQQAFTCGQFSVPFHSNTWLYQPMGFPQKSNTKYIILRACLCPASREPWPKYLKITTERIQWNFAWSCFSCYPKKPNRPSKPTLTFFQDLLADWC